MTGETGINSYSRARVKGAVEVLFKLRIVYLPLLGYNAFILHRTTTRRCVY
eukprot:COSAG01_NODE_13174_length_1625_cov_1.295544_2_plen_51_part_00